MHESGFTEYLPTVMAVLLLSGPVPAYRCPIHVDPHLVNVNTLSSVASDSAILLITRMLGFQRISQSHSFSSLTTQAQEHWERGRALADSGDLEEAAVELRLAVALAPSHPEYVYTLGVILAKQGKLEEAASRFQQALKFDPENLAIRQNLAAAEWQVGKLPDAVRNLQFILKQRPNDQEASFLLGMVLENSGEYDKAAKLLAAAHDRLRLHPESVAALLHCYYEISKRAEAHDLENSLLRDSSQTQAIFLSAGVAEEAGDYQAAERMLVAVRDSYPSSTEVNYQLAVLRYRTGKYSDAEDILKRLVVEGDETSKYLNLLAWCFAKQGETQEAVKAFDRAVDLDPRKVSNYIDLATVLMDAGLLPPSLEAANKAVEVDPSSYFAYRIRGQIQMRQHDYTAAVDSYRKAAELNNANSGPFLDLAEAEAAAGQLKKSSSILEATIKKFPREAHLYYKYAVIILHHSSSDAAANQSKAATLLQTTVTLDNSISEAHYELGNIWLAQGQSAKALAELQWAAKLNPSDGNTHYALWLVLRKLGRTKQAEDELKIFSKLKAEESDKTH